MALKMPDMWGVDLGEYDGWGAIRGHHDPADCVRWFSREFNYETRPEEWRAGFARWVPCHGCEWGDGIHQHFQPSDEGRGAFMCMILSRPYGPKPQGMCENKGTYD